MKTSVFFVLMLVVAGLTATIVLLQPAVRPAAPKTAPPDAEASTRPHESLPSAVSRQAVSPARSAWPGTNMEYLPGRSAEGSSWSTNKLERLAQIRETFRALAAGDPVKALRTAKEISDGTERETALLALVTEWTHGELSPPRERAQAIDRYGLEAGLGMELAKNPDLAAQWANELTDGSARTAVLQRAAIELTGSDPMAAFAMGDQLPAEERRKFYDAVFAGWAANDTQAAMESADELPDPAERDAAMQAIRSVAPVGIGTELSMQDGYPVINRLLPGTPAELSGQIRPGDRIVGLAQGDNNFVDARGLSLQDVVQMIRGAPGSSLQLQLVSADAPPGSAPQTVSIVRDQIKFKR